MNTQAPCLVCSSFHKVLFALLVFGALADAAAPTTLPAVEKGTLSGTVVDADGKPVAGARVWIINQRFSSEPIVAETHSGPDGRYRLGPMTPFPRSLGYKLRIEAAGLAPVAFDRFSFSVFPNTDTPLGTTQLFKGRIFSGQVLDQQGKPVAGAAVEVHVWRRISAHRYGGDWVMPASTVITGTDGRFQTQPLPVAFLRVEVRAKGFKQNEWPMRPILPGGSESLGPLHLQPDVPLDGVVVDEQGRPIEGVTTFAGTAITTDAAGRFTVRGHGRAFKAEMYFRKRGYRQVATQVERNEKELLVAEPAEANTQPTYKPVQKLRVVMSAVPQIKGRVVDDETSQPVKLSQLVLCFCERQLNGDITLSGCRGDAFEQPEPGHFTVSYGGPGEYHLAFSADGYHDGEIYTQKITRPESIDVGVVRLRRNKEGTKPVVARQHLTGVVTRDGKPVGNGWVVLWQLYPVAKTDSMSLMRGRPVHRYWPIARSDALVRDGQYKLEVPFQSGEWYVVVEEPGRAPTVVGPVAVALNEKKVLDIASVAGGSVSGTVRGIAAEWMGHTYVVASNEIGVRAETRVDSAGRYQLSELPPGDYSLKVGHEAYRDRDAVDPEMVPLDRRDMPLDVWKRATRVQVQAGRTTSDISLELPPE